jgi:(+)-trans-carveol dehydrogenase
MSARYEGKVVFISGAARGQGRSHAIRLAEEGADIIAIDLCRDLETVPYALGTADELQETVAAVEALDRRIIAVQADARDFDAVKAAVDRGVAEFGRLDVAIANHGILSFGGFMDITEESWREMLDVNLLGPWNVARAAAPHMIAGGRGGVILMTSSAAGLQGYQGISHYVAAKHGLVGLMRSMALELGQYGIRVNTIHPINCNTPMIMNEPTFRIFRPELENPTLADFAEASQAGNVLPIPFSEPSDITNGVAFLASDEARAITGVTFRIDLGAAMPKA